MCARFSVSFVGSSVVGDLERVRLWLRAHYVKAAALVLTGAMLIGGSLAFIMFRVPKTLLRVTAFSPPFEFSMELNKTDFQVGENVSVRFSFRNTGNQTVHVLWPNAFYYWEGSPPVLSDMPMLFDIIVTDENGTKVFWWSARRARTNEAYETDIHPGEEIVLTNLWNQKTNFPNDLSTPVQECLPVPAGTYFVKGLIPPLRSPFGLDEEWHPRIETPALRITIRC